MGQKSSTSSFSLEALIPNLMSWVIKRNRIIFLIPGVVLCALFLGAILIFIAGGSPLSGYLDLLHGAFLGKRQIRQLLNESAPLAIMSLGYSVAFRARFLGIGGQGQQDVGGVIATIVLLNFGIANPWIGLPAAIIFAGAAGCLIGLLVAFFKVRFSMNEVVVSLMMNYMIFYLLSWVVRLPLRNPTGFIPESARIPSQMVLPKLFGSDIDITSLVAVFLALFLRWLLSSTALGFRIVAVGKNVDASRANGISIMWTVLIASGLAAFLAGIVGALRLAGPEGRLSQGFSTSLGFTAIVVTLLARNNPLGILAASIFMRALGIGGAVMQRTQEIPQAVSQVIQALVVILALCAYQLIPDREISNEFE